MKKSGDVPCAHQFTHHGLPSTVCLSNNMLHPAPCQRAPKNPTLPYPLYRTGKAFIFVPQMRYFPIGFSRGLVVSNFCPPPCLGMEGMVPSPTYLGNFLNGKPTVPLSPRSSLHSPLLSFLQLLDQLLTIKSRIWAYFILSLRGGFSQSDMISCESISRKLEQKCFVSVFFRSNSMPVPDVVTWGWLLCSIAWSRWLVRQIGKYSLTTRTLISVKAIESFWAEHPTFETLLTWTRTHLRILLSHSGYCCSSYARKESTRVQPTFYVFIAYTDSYLYLSTSFLFLRCSP